MTFNSVWFETQIPEEFVSLIEKESKPYDDIVKVATVREGEIFETRDAQTSWIPATSWVGGFCMSYVLKSNRENFMYDIEGIDNNELQYTEYQEGEYYDWHIDDNINRCMINDKLLHSADNHGENIAILAGEYIRKLSFSIQLSDPEDYEGGELEFKVSNYNSRKRGDFNLDEPFHAPNKKGTIIIFDSRVKHRVREVKSGVRNSLVGWVVGPRWK